MTDSFTETEHTGFFGSIGESIKGVLTGIVLFFASFVVLWMGEGMINWAEVAKTAVVAPADKVDAALNGKFIAVTGALDSKDNVGDPEFLAPGPYVTLRRQAEMWAWVEEKETKTKKNLGGGKTKTTTYDYELQWTEHPKASSSFKYREGHENPPMPVASQTFKAKTVTVGAYGLNAERAELPSGDPLPLTPSMLANMPAASGTTNALKGKSPKVDGSYLFLGNGTVAAPQVGDVRLLFKALARGTNVTLFGALQGSSVEPHVHEGKTFLRALKGTRDEAIAKLDTEHSIIVWLCRLGGFLCMWIGMGLILDPIAAVMDVIPALGSLGRFAIGLVTLPIAIVLSAVTIVVSMIFHSVLAMIVVGVLGLVVVAVVLKKKKPTPAV